MAEALYNDGFLLFYEACSLESLGNSIWKFASMGILKRRGEYYSITNQQPEIYYFMDPEQDVGKVKELYERMTFFKPPLTLITGMINFEDDVKRILSSAPQTQTKFANKL